MELFFKSFKNITSIQMNFAELKNTNKPEIKSPARKPGEAATNVVNVQNIWAKKGSAMENRSATKYTMIPLLKRTKITANQTSSSHHSATVTRKKRGTENKQTNKKSNIREKAHSIHFQIILKISLPLCAVQTENSVRCCWFCDIIAFFMDLHLNTFLVTHHMKCISCPRNTNHCKGIVEIYAASLHFHFDFNVLVFRPDA